MDPIFGILPEEMHSEGYEQCLEDLNDLLGTFSSQSSPYACSDGGPPIGIVEEERANTAEQIWQHILQETDREELGAISI